MKKRILSLLLALALLCAMLPQIALPARADDAYSGKCGENLTWRFDPDTGTLTIEGSGRMYGYYWESQPWTAYMQDITKVALPDGLTKIGDDAFDGCTGLTSITFPDGLTEIGRSAFYGCTGLTSVTFPDGLTEIGNQTFYGCTGLTSITFPDGLTSIGSLAFCGCTGLTSVTFPDGLTKIDSGAFSDCTGLKVFSVAGGNPNYSSDASGVLFNKDKTQLIQYPSGRSGSYTVPNSVTSIGGYAFNGCTGLTSVNFPAGLTSIGSWAFDGCTGLTEITLPDGLTYIGEGAFGGCTGLTSVTFPDGLTSIGDLAFDGCTGLTSVTFPDGLTEIGSRAFSDCTGLKVFSVAGGNPNYSSDACGVLFNKDKTQLIQYPSGRSGSYTVPNSVTFIGSWAFYHCTGLTSITFPDGLTSIGDLAFDGCTGLTSVTFPDGLTEIGSRAFSDCTGLTSVTFPDGLTSIGVGTFWGCTGLTSVNFPDGLTSIGSWTFWGCTGLTSVTFPDGLTSIGDLAFYHCTGLTSVTFPDGLTSIGNSAFYGCTGLTSVNFPAGLTSIGDATFANCTGLTSVLIPESVVQIGEWPFGYCWVMESGSYRPLENFTIYGYKGTAAQTYAQENGIKFVPLDPQSGFADVKPKQYYYKPMLWALEHGITSGTSRVTFSPNDTCTRGQVMTFLYAAKGKPEANWDNNPFVDVKKSKFYYKPVLWAVQNGITNGMDATHFQPNGGCTRAQVVTFLWAMRGKPEPKAGNNPFTDIKKSNWYYKAVLWASQNGITSGVDATHFGPNQTCTRGQVVTFLYALLGK